MELVWRCNWRLTLSELRGALGVRDQESLELHLEPRIK